MQHNTADGNYICVTLSYTVHLVCIEDGTGIERNLLQINFDNMLLHTMFTRTNGCLYENTWCLKSNHNNWNKVCFTRFYFIFGMVHNAWTISYGPYESWYDMICSIWYAWYDMDHMISLISKFYSIFDQRIFRLK